MKGLSWLFVVLTLLNAWRFFKTRDQWFLGLAILFGLTAVREHLPPNLFLALLVGGLLWLTWLGVWKFVPSLRIRRLMGNPKLRALPPIERRWRKSLDAGDETSLKMWEMLTEKRFTTPEAVAFLERMRDEDAKTELRNAERIAEEEAEIAIERAIEAENKDLEITAVTSPLEVISSDGSRLWLQLEAIDDLDEELAYDAPVRCTVWSEPPHSGIEAQSSILSLADAIDFKEATEAREKPVFWSSRSPEFKEMLRNRCLISKVTVADDGRERFGYQIEDRSFVIMTKYLYWRCDLALDPDQQTVWVRISEMTAEIWGGDFNATDGSQPEFEDIERIPAFVFPVTVDRLLPSKNPAVHFRSIEKMIE